jgi:hypothetical protein
MYSLMSIHLAHRYHLQAPANPHVGDSVKVCDPILSLDTTTHISPSLQSDATTVRRNLVSPFFTPCHQGPPLRSTHISPLSSTTCANSFPSLSGSTQFPVFKSTNLVTPYMYVSLSCFLCRQLHDCRLVPYHIASASQRLCTRHNQGDFSD